MWWPFESPAARIRVLASDRPEALGFLISRRIADLVEIDLLGVVPEARRLGGGAALLEDLKRVECGAGAAELRLELRISNRSARSLYLGAGFVVVGSRSRYYPDGEDALLLTYAPPQSPSSDLHHSKRDR